MVYTRAIGFNDTFNLQIANHGLQIDAKKSRVLKRGLSLMLLVNAVAGAAIAVGVHLLAHTTLTIPGAPLLAVGVAILWISTFATSSSIVAQRRDYDREHEDYKNTPVSRFSPAEFWRAMHYVNEHYEDEQVTIPSDLIETLSRQEQLLLRCPEEGNAGELNENFRRSIVGYRAFHAPHTPATIEINQLFR